MYTRLVIATLFMASALTTTADTRGPFDALRELYEEGKVEEARKRVLEGAALGIKMHRRYDPKKDERSAQRHLESMSSAAAFLYNAFDAEVQLGKAAQPSEMLIDAGLSVLMFMADAKTRVRDLQKGEPSDMIKRQFDLLDRRKKRLEKALLRYNAGQPAATPAAPAVATPQAVSGKQLLAVQLLVDYYAALVKRDETGLSSVLSTESGGTNAKGLLAELSREQQRKGSMLVGARFDDSTRVQFRAHKDAGKAHLIVTDVAKTLTLDGEKHEIKDTDHFILLTDDGVYKLVVGGK